jgi:hypothetical protein
MNISLRHEDTRGSGGILPLFLTSAVDGGEWSPSLPKSFNPGDVLSNKKKLRGFSPRVNYTDRVTTACRRS